MSLITDMTCHDMICQYGDGIHTKNMVLPWMQGCGFQSNKMKYLQSTALHTRVLVLCSLYIQGMKHKYVQMQQPDPVFHPNGWNGVDHDPGSISGVMTPKMWDLEHGEHVVTTCAQSGEYGNTMGWAKGP